MIAKEKKVTVLAASNILTISKSASKDLKNIKKEINLLTNRQEQLRKVILDCETKRAANNEKLLSEKIMSEIQQNIDTANKELKNGNLTEALHIARRLVAAHGEVKLAIDTLGRIQKAYDKGSLKERKRLAEKNKRDRFFLEAGIAQEVATNDLPVNTPLKSLSVMYRVFGKYFEASAKRRDYLQKQAVFNKIEKLLVQTGSITKV